MTRRAAQRPVLGLALLLALLFNIPISLAGIGPVLVHASHLSQPLVGVWSDTYKSHNITDTSLTSGEFTVKVNVTETPPINGYEFRLNYNTAVLTATKAIVKEGTFFGDKCFICLNDTSSAGAVRVTISVAGAYVRSGNGTLAFITFQVIGLGATVLDINRDSLALGASQVPHQTQDGLFANTTAKPPVAQFTFTPPQPVQGMDVTFDASASKDPDGTIVSYFWRWGADPRTDTTTNPVIIHMFKDVNGKPTYGTFTVSLTVRDDTGLTAQETEQVVVTRLPVRDVLIGSFESSLLTASPGQKVTLSVTVANLGTFDENTTLTISTGTTLIATREISLPSGQSTDLDIPWDTAGLAPSVYRVWANVTAVQGETNIEDNSRSIFVNIVGGASGASTPLIIGAGIGVVAITGFLVFLLRRRKPRVET